MRTPSDRITHSPPCSHFLRYHTISSIINRRALSNPSLVRILNIAPPRSRPQNRFGSTYVSCKKNPSYVQVRSSDTAALSTDPTPNTECSRDDRLAMYYTNRYVISSAPLLDDRPIRVGHPRPILAFFTIYGSTLTQRGFRSFPRRAPPHSVRASTGVTRCFVSLPRPAISGATSRSATSAISRYRGAIDARTRPLN